MPTFLYESRTKEGHLQKGKIEASNLGNATRILQGKGLIITDLKLEKSVPFYERDLSFFNSVGYRDLAVFSRQLSSLIGAGITIVEALELLALQTDNQVLREAMEDIAASITSGVSFSAALNEYPDIFSSFYVQLIKTGEVSGTLGQTTLFLAEHTERSYHTYHKVKGALTYPVFVITTFIVIFMGIFLFIVPQFVGILTENNTEIPFLTRVMIGLSDLVKAYWFVPFIAIGVGIRMIFTPQGKLWWDKIQLKIPVLGKVFLYLNVYRFSESFFILLRGGVPIVEALTISEKIVGNHIYQNIIADVREAVLRGQGVGETFAKYPNVPPLFSQMLSIGEKTGNLDAMTERVALFYEEELNTLIDNATTLIQPVIIVFLGVGVLVFILGVLLPIFTSFNAVGA